MRAFLRNLSWPNLLLPDNSIGILQMQEHRPDVPRNLEGCRSWTRIRVTGLGPTTCGIISL